MSFKKVCLDCKIAFNPGFENDVSKENICNNCGEVAVILPHRFRSPKKTDQKKWGVVKFLISKGFLYQHIYEISDQEKLEKYVAYPENMNDAIEFAAKYKSQVIKND